jgi:3-oxoacyl-[acyl-carrier-protein] synthase II
MGAAGALELAGNLPAFNDNIIHPFLNLDNLDPECEIKNIVAKDPIERENITYIMNNSFGMLGINSCLIIKKYQD